MARPRKNPTPALVPVSTLTPWSHWIDRWMLLIVSGLVVAAWIVSDAIGLQYSEGTKAALVAFVGYALLKSKSDSRWRSLERSRHELEDLRALVADFEQATPGSTASARARRALVSSTRGHEEDEDSE
jgi:hypothetical protein